MEKQIFKSHEYTDTYAYIHEFLALFKKGGPVTIEEIPNEIEKIKLALLAQLIVKNNFNPVEIFDELSDQDYNWAKKILKKEQKKKYQLLIFTVNTLLE